MAKSVTECLIMVTYLIDVGTVILANREYRVTKLWNKGPVIIYQPGGGGWAILGGGGHEKNSTPNGGSKFHL